MDLDLVYRLGLAVRFSDGPSLRPFGGWLDTRREIDWADRHEIALMEHEATPAEWNIIRQAARHGIFRRAVDGSDDMRWAVHNAPQGKAREIAYAILKRVRYAGDIRALKAKIVDVETRLAVASPAKAKALLDEKATLVKSLKELGA